MRKKGNNNIIVQKCFLMINTNSCIISEDIGCRIGVNKFNVLAYADDIVLISPSAGGLRFLMNIFNDSVGVHRLYLNVNKTKIMVFRNKKKKVFNHIPFL